MRTTSLLAMGTVTCFLLGACSVSPTEQESEQVGSASAAIASSGALAVITTNSMVSNSKVLSAYVSQRRQTKSVYLVTENKTYRSNGVTDSVGWAQGVDLTQPPSLANSSARADAIRAWLKANYSTLGITDALLIGNPNPDGGEVPMKNIYHYKHFEDLALIYSDAWVWDLVKWTCTAPSAPASYYDCTAWKDQHSSERALPTDYYYSNLTYVWPTDADGDIVDIKVTDFSQQDVNVGRLPVYNNDYGSVDKILSKFITYSTSTDTAWRKSALLGMDTHGADGSATWVPLGETTKNDLLTPNGFNTFRVYETYTPYGCTTDSCKIKGELTPTSVVNMGSAWAGSAWSGCQGAICSSPKRNFGVVFWASHGGATGSTDIIEINGSSNYVPALDDSHPAFTVGMSCSNSDPYYTNNVSTSLLKNGAIASLGASRISWPDGDLSHPYENSAGENDVAYGYLFELVNNKRTAGDALATVRAHLNSVVAAVPISDWHKKMDYAAQLLLFNLYGDPTIGLDAAPTNPYVTPLLSHTPLAFNAAAGATKTFYANDWPSKGNPYWTANVVLSVSSVDGKAIPISTVWVNGTSYSIGGPGKYYQVLNIADVGPYTIDVVSSAASKLQLTLDNQ